MAEKKALLILAPSASVSGDGKALTKMMRKAALFTSYTAGNVLDGSVAEANIVKTDAAGVAAAFEKDAAFVVVDLGAAADIDAALETALDAADRRTVTVLAGKDGVAFYGLGVDARAGSVARAAKAGDVLPTLAYIADLPLTMECTGAVLYQALKDPNMKTEELTKMREALTRMEGALARDNREPWDKHDCA